MSCSFYKLTRTTTFYVTSTLSGHNTCLPALCEWMVFWKYALASHVCIQYMCVLYMFMCVHTVCVECMFRCVMSACVHTYMCIRLC